MARSITVVFFGLGLSLALLSACARDTSAWSGKWNGTLKRTSHDAPRDPLQEAIDAISINIKPDRTFDLVESGMPYSGRWSFSGDMLVLTVERVIGRPVSDSDEERSLSLALTENGTLILDEEGRSDLKAIMLSRAVQPAK